ADLFYRVSGIEISLPPLRDRPEDIPALAEHFVEVHGGDGRTIDCQAIALFQRYHWPGNIRELERIVQRGLAWSVDREIGVNALPQYLVQNQRAPQFGSLRPTSLRAWAAIYVQTVFQECGGNKRLACRRLQINYRTLQSYLMYNQPQDRNAAA